MIMRNELTNSAGTGSDGEDFGPVDSVAVPPRHVLLKSFLPSLLADVLTGDPPPEYQFTQHPWGELSLRPGEITCIGGAPNCGKTALLLQMVTEALLMNPSLRAAFACVEMSERVLVMRTMARLSRVFLTKILRRQRDHGFAASIEAVRPQLESLQERLVFIQAPFTMVDVQATCAEFQPHIVALDYLQRIPADRSLMELRQQVSMTLTRARAVADQGVAVLVAAALNRQASSRSQSRAEATDDNVNDLAVFRDSSDIEYTADDAFVLTKAGGNLIVRYGEEYRPKKLILRHVKSRNGVTMHVPLTFDGRLQEFQLRPWQDNEGDAPQPVGPVRATPRRGFEVDNFMEGNGGTNWLS